MVEAQHNCGAHDAGERTDNREPHQIQSGKNSRGKLQNREITGKIGVQPVFPGSSGY